MNGAPTVDVNGTVFSYAEIRTGSRRIKIWTAGEDPVEYKPRPEPHFGSGKYSKDEPVFYRELATAIGQLYVAAPGVFPPFGTVVHVDVTDEDYTLESR